MNSGLAGQRRRYAEQRLENLTRTLNHENETRRCPELAIYVTGSYGRLEASGFSDIDLFFVHNGKLSESEVPYVDRAVIDASIIKACRKHRFPEFTQGGVYLTIHYLEDILAHLGSPADDYDNHFTARMLMLLESRPLINADVYDTAIDKIIESYFRDYHDHEKDFSPVFLVNDIQRFWKTMCLNYEHRRNRQDANVASRKSKHHLKNLKLKYSRLMTCYSMVGAILADEHQTSPQEIKKFVQMTPFERLSYVGLMRPGLKTLISKIEDDYAWFLERTGKSESEVLRWIGRKDARNRAFENARNFGVSMYKLIQECPGDKDTLRFLVI